MAVAHVNENIRYEPDEVPPPLVTIGTGFQNKWIFPDLLGEGFVGVLFGNGMTSGALVAIIMMVFMELTGPRRRRLEVRLDAEALPSLEEFLRGVASRAGWNEASTERLALVGEETLASMSAEEDGLLDGDRPRRLAVTARKDIGGAELEFVSASEGRTWRTGCRTLERRRTYPTAGRFRSGF